MDGVSYVLLLFVAMPLKYFAGQPLAVTIAGSLHGALFILLCASLFQMTFIAKWGFWKSCAVFFAAFIPFAPFFLDRWIKSQDMVK